MKSTSISDWLESLGSKNPTPGGGAVSALNGAIAAAQLKMVCGYTKDEEIQTKIGFLTQKIETFLILAEADSIAFEEVNNAYGAKDTMQIDLSLVRAAEVSIEVATNCAELISFFEERREQFNKRLNADLVVVIANLRAAVQGAQAMERTNLKSMRGEKPQNIQAAVKDCDELIERLDQLSEKAGK